MSKYVKINSVQPDLNSCIPPLAVINKRETGDLTHLSTYLSSTIYFYLFSSAKNMCREFRKDEPRTSHSSREKRSGDADIDQVRSYSRGMIRDVRSVCRFASSLSLPFSGYRRQETEERSRYELQRLVRTYVRTYWPDAPRRVQ